MPNSKSCQKMELSKDEIKEIIRDVKEGYGHDVTVKDIAFCVLSKVFNDEELAFKVLHGGKVGKKEREKYQASDKMIDLAVYLNKNYTESPATQSVSHGTGVTFDELKSGMEDDLRDIEDFINTNKDMLEPKEMATLIGRKSDIRVKLAEKFGTSDKSEENRVVVIAKYNDICPYCHREVAIKK